MGVASRESRSRRASLNDRTTVWLVILVGLSPLIIGGNVPVLWCAYALVVSISAAIYFASLGRFGAGSSTAFARWRLPASLWGAACVYIAIQTVPFGAFMPIAFASHDGTTVEGHFLALAPGQAAMVLAQFLTYGLVFVLFMVASSRETRSVRVLRTLFWIVVAYALIALTSIATTPDVIVHPDRWFAEARITGPFVNRNSFATFLALGLVTGASLLLARIDVLVRDRKHTLHWPSQMLPTSLGLAALIAALLATQSRMGVFAALCGLALVFFLWRGAATRLGAALAAAGGAASLGAISVLYGSGLLDRLGSVEQSFDVRGALYAQVVGMIAARPWLGYGAGSFEVAFPLFHRPPVSADLVWDKAHSTYLGLWADLGIIFGSFPLLAVALICVTVMRACLKRAGGGGATPALLAALGGSTVVAVHSLVDFSLEIFSVALLFTSLLAAGAAVACRRRNDTAEAKDRPQDARVDAAQES